MNITFFIGNGFDLNQGLNTRFSDFESYFNKNSSADNIIKKWGTKNTDLWSDMEYQLGQSMKELSEQQIKAFQADKQEMESLLLEYLETEQTRFQLGPQDEENVKKELIRSITDYIKVLSTVDKNTISNTRSRNSNSDIVYQFISFNYTNTLDRVVEIAKKAGSIGSHQSQQGRNMSHTIGGVHHIHGTINSEMILGVNDINQINNSVLQKNKRFMDTQVKERINRRLGQQKTENVEKIVSDSKIIAIFGMSYGVTDKRWWKLLGNWLLQNQDNTLVLFNRMDARRLKWNLPSVTITETDDCIDFFMQRAEMEKDKIDSDTIRRRILVAHNTNIFDFKKYVKNNVDNQ